MKPGRSAIHRQTYVLPILRFEDQQLTLFSGLVIFQRLFEHLQALLRTMVLDRVQALKLRRLTLDFDGSVIGTGRSAEGTALGFNKGTSKNAVMTQIWIAMCVYLLLSYIKFLHKISPSLQQILRLLQLNLFERRDLLELLRGDPPEPLVSPNQAALAFS